MISAVDVNDVRIKKLLDRPSPFLCKIKTEASVFGQRGLATLYIRNGPFSVGIASLYCGELTVYDKSPRAASHWGRFAELSPSVNSVVCDGRTAARIRRATSNLYTSMRFNIVKEIRSSGGDCIPVTDHEELYRVLCSAFEAYESVKYDEFYCDLFHRKSSADCGFFHDGKMQSVAAVSAENATCALISDVATRYEQRGLGLGRQVIGGICAQLREKKKRAFLFCRNQDVLEFYKRCGFKSVGKYERLRKV